MTITQINICQYYKLNEEEWHDNFLVYLDEKLANWDFRNYWKSNEDSKTNLIGGHHNEYLDIIRKKVSYDVYHLDDAKINVFLEKLNDFEDIFKPNSEPTFFAKLTYSVCVEFYDENGMWFNNIFWQFPKNWIDFGILLEYLIGFDVLNIDYSKQFITTINYDIKKEGIFDLTTNRKLDLKKINFKHYSSDYSFFTKFCIDFQESKMYRLFDDNCVFSSQNLTDFELNKINGLLIEHGVFLWNEKDSWVPVDQDNPQCMWDIELIFDNDAIFHAGSSDSYTLTYFDFGSAMLDLFGKDLLKIAEPDYGKFKCKYALKYECNQYKKGFIEGLNFGALEVIENNKFEIAKYMFYEGWSFDTISEITGLNFDEIKSLPLH